MESAFGADFAAVRVHVGPQPARIGAIAFATGNDIYFAPGRYEPNTSHGQHLLGHELAHIIQQRQGRVQAPATGMAVIQDVALEAEADRLAARAVAKLREIPRAGAMPTVQRSTAPLVMRGPVQRMKRRGSTDNGPNKLRAVDNGNGGIDRSTTEDPRIDSFTPSILANVNIFNVFTSYLTMDEWLTLLQTNRALRNALEPHLISFISDNIGVAGLDPLVIRGIAKVLSRLVAGEQWPTGWAQQAPRQLTGREVQAGNDVARALIWRGYGRGGANRTNKPVTLERFGRQLVRHLAATLDLRTFATTQPNNAYPNRAYYRANEAYPINDQTRELVADVGTYWRGSFGVDSGAATLEDHFARLIAAAFGLRSSGQNITVIATGGHRYEIYSNQPIANATSTILTNPEQLRNRFPIETGARGLRAQAIALIRSRTARFVVVPPNIRGRRLGVGRVGRFDIPFHSEVQRFDQSDPWNNLGRSGNDYCACPQCAAVYQAIGRKDLYQGGSHRRKSPSVIPPRVRDNSVFLKEYLGPVAYKKFKNLSINDRAQFLDHLERFRERDVDAVGPALIGPKKSFTW